MKYLLLFLFCYPVLTYSQNDLLEDIDSESRDTSYVIAAFKGLKVVNFESTKLVYKNEFTLVVSHRFGSIENGFDTFFGLDNAVTRLNFIYGITDAFNIGVSRSSFLKVYDVTVKYRLKRQEKNGLNIFRKNCASCHTEPLFTNNEFRNNGLTLDPFLNDYGRMQITNKSEDSLKFKVPTLRNIQFTPPYMHDGRFQNLKEVISHYKLGIVHSKTLAKELNSNLNLSHKEEVDLLVFLRTLTDYEFLFNDRFSYPF